MINKESNPEESEREELLDSKYKWKHVIIIYSGYLLVLFYFRELFPIRPGALRSQRGQDRGRRDRRGTEEGKVNLKFVC